MMPVGFDCLRTVGALVEAHQFGVHVFPQLLHDFDHPCKRILGVLYAEEFASIGLRPMQP